MCYYNGQKVTHEEFIRLKTLEKLVSKYDFLNRDLHDGFAYGPIAVLKPDTDKKDFEIVQMEWGFIPPYWKTREEVQKFRGGFKDGSGKWVQYLTLNATSEEMLLPRKMYRDAALKRRCLIISSGFYEWRHVFPKNKRTGLPVKTPVRIPHYITVKDQPYFFMAGIWQPWEDQVTHEKVETVSIVTTAAPEGHIMAKIHNSKMRMPTILNEDLAWEWMFGDLSEERITEIGKTQFPSEQMTAYTIAKDFKTALEPMKMVEWEELVLEI
jgi:putative SOS response-associated peptidase YedK